MVDSPSRRTPNRARNLFSADGSLAIGGGEPGGSRHKFDKSISRDEFERVPSRGTSGYDRVPSAASHEQLPDVFSAAIRRVPSQSQDNAVTARDWIRSLHHWDTADTGGYDVNLFRAEEESVLCDGKEARIEFGVDARLGREALLARDALQEGLLNLSTRFTMHRFFTKVDTGDLECLIGECFSRWDQDGSGSLDRKELTVALAEMADRPTHTVSRGDVDQILHLFDTDRNAAIDMDEFKHMVSPEPVVAITCTIVCNHVSLWHHIAGFPLARHG
jgi:hypothetical protein